PARAVRHASLVPARHYGLTDRGAVAPGYRADLAVVDDLRDFRVRLTLKDGVVVARDGAFVGRMPAATLPAEEPVRVGPLEAEAVGLGVRGATAAVIRIHPGQLVTSAETQPVRPDAGGCWTFDPDRDTVLTASVERHRATGHVGVGLVAGFGLRRGAIGS